MYTQIINPDTHRKIYVYGTTYNKLVKKYGKEWERNQPIYNTEKSPKSPIILKNYDRSKNVDLHEDVMYQILLNSDINSIKNYCISKKNIALCNNKNLWKIIFERDQLPLYKMHDNYKDWIDEYNKIYHIKLEVQQIIKLMIINLDRYRTPSFEIKIKFLGEFIYDNISYNNVITINYKNDMFIIPYYSVIKNTIIYDIENFLISLLYNFPNANIGTPEGGHTLPLRKKDLLTDDLGYEYYPKLTESRLNFYKI